ncbi:hypothetical protein BKP43_53380 [Variovorax boronicumulans]|uniref:DUF5682 family protein n=1 Tax=Variovorax boronicumulans TaxID=436515 RepID=UPI000BB35E8B|nr:DUF5682 family protein [Variovorax boronicumulans]PBI84338.1 hypothetical protein BKP43_53380 [Variovorax boronicumulans]
MSTSAAPSPLHYFGIRHHGPGCARSLLRAFESLQPDCILVEGPPEAEPLLSFLAHADLQPPVAVLIHASEDTGLAAFYPFATFSPEWQALQWGAARGVPTRFIDLPQAHRMAIEQAARAADEAKAQAPEETPLGDDETDTVPVAETVEAPEEEQAAHTLPDDPFDWLAHAAGYADGESWWNHMVEERGDGEDLFGAIAEAMTAVRAETPEDRRGVRAMEREQRREAFMRQSIREAVKAGHQRIAVVCGAWHVPALQGAATAKADAALLKGLPKLKVLATWVPWTYRHLTSASGYGAGIDSPGWYEHLWQQGHEVAGRSTGWLARVARLLREHDLDCSSAHLIEATRLADTLAALRERPAPGLPELDEAVRSVICMGEQAPLTLIRERLTVGDRMGQVPADVPTVPLQRDLEQAQKSLRLKPEATAKTLDLDLRQPNDLARSHLLHRLRLLDLPWGEVTAGQRASRGTFHEVWQLQWQPEFALRVIEASRFGATVAHAASARVMEGLATETSLTALAEQVDTVLLADLPVAVQAVTRALEDRAALTGDAVQLIGAVPPLANVFRYGSVRQTDSALLSHVLDSLIVRGAIGLPIACGALDAEAAESLRTRLIGAHDAVRLRDGEETTTAWRNALRSIAFGETGAPLLRGVSCRLLLDDAQIDSDGASQQLARNLSAGAPPTDAAAWLEGFLNRNAMVLLHDDAVWSLVDGWLAGLGEEHFVQVLPLVRRSFADFSGADRRALGERAKRGAVGGTLPSAVAATDWDESRAVLALPLLRELLGVKA